MMSLNAMPKYDAYKDSGVDWLAEIPAEWPLLPGKVFLEERQDKNIGMIESQVLSLSYGKIVIKPEEKLVGLVPESFETYQIVDPGNIIIRCTDLQNDKTSLRTGLANDRGIITSAYLNLQTKAGYSQRFMHYYLHALDLCKALYKLGSGLRQNLSFEDFKYLPVPDISINHQEAIANFLDEKTAQIDQAIDIKEKQIALLKERKQIIIQNAVTKGLNPSAPMKGSGVDWIGDIPAHWEVIRSKRLFMERKTKAPKGSKQLTASQKYGMIYQDEYMELEGRRVTQVMLNYSILKEVRAGDFVISMRSFQGGLEYSPYSGAASSAYLPIYPSREIADDYYKYLFKSSRYIEALSSTSNLVRDGQALRFDNFEMVDLLYPPINEQGDIAQFISDTIDIMAKVEESFYIQIDKLKEYKASLINSAVTGKIKVI